MYTPVKTLLLQCNWLSIKQLVIFHSLLQIYKTKVDKRPGFLFHKVSKKFPYKTRISDNNGIKTDKNITSELGKQNFSYFAINNWNGLPPTLKEAP